MNTHSENATTRYVLGFLGSLVCTFAAYWFVVAQPVAHGTIASAVIALALVQLFIQLALFLHLGDRSNSLNRLALTLTLIIVGIVVAGSLWIMFSLNARMMPGSAQMIQYTQGQDSM